MPLARYDMLVEGSTIPVGYFAHNPFVAATDTKGRIAWELLGLTWGFLAFVLVIAICEKKLRREPASPQRVLDEKMGEDLYRLLRIQWRLQRQSRKRRK